MSTVSKESAEALNEEAPMAFGTPTKYQPISKDILAKLLTPFLYASIGQLYFGPAGLSEDGVPWVVLITRDIKRPAIYRESGRFGLLGWRWNTSPSCFFSLTAMGLRESRPHVRWMGSSEDPVVQAIRDVGRVRVCMAHPTGSHSGWFEAVFSMRGPSGHQVPSNAPLLRQWTFPPSGIPHSAVGQRFDSGERGDRDMDNEIPLWPHSLSDGWLTLQGTGGPWRGDLEEADEKIADWASYFHHKRARAAGLLLAIKERSLYGESPWLMNAEGRWVLPGSEEENVEAFLQQHQSIRKWLLAVVGPTPDASLAHEAAFQLLNDPKGIFAFVANFMGLMRTLNDFLLAEALQQSLEAAVIDSRITDLGRKRPWLKNIGNSELELCTINLDSGCPRDDLDTLWRSGLQFGDLLDAGEWFGPTDLPAPLSVVNEALESVRIEGSIEDAFCRAQQLLYEAQESRQWSVPWGARVQIQFGSFVAMRIFEKDGEFSCHFLDEQERYFHVAIGLGQGNPTISNVDLVRKSANDEVEWNEDAEVSLQLIASAIVRDFLVVEQREKVFNTKPYRARVGKRKIQTIIYLPRVRYSLMRHDQPPVSDAAKQHRAKHKVAFHVRRSASASATQHFLAQRYGLSIPQGFTFVRPHERGASGLSERVNIYRSRSASRMIYEAISSAPEGSRPAWFDFEKACARLLEREGKSVIHQSANRDGDGGVDLFAVDQDGASWVVQCKCWAPNRPVGPDVVRELIGSIIQADRNSDQNSRGMIITTSRLTSGAALEAEAAGFRVIDGSELSNYSLE